MEFKIKDESFELEQIENNKSLEEYRNLKRKIEYVYKDYLEQREGLVIRRNNMKVRRDEGIRSIFIIIFVLLLLVGLAEKIAGLYLISVVVIMPTICILMGYIGSTILRIREYAVMTEKQKPMNYFSDKVFISFNQEERFLNEVIAEYEEELCKDLSEEELTEEIMNKLTKMTFPKTYYATAIKREFKRRYIYIWMAAMVVFALILVMLSRGGVYF